MKCEKCGNEFDGHGNRKFCDDCLTTTCAKCGKEFKVSQPSLIKKWNYCSRACTMNEDLREAVRSGKYSTRDLMEMFGISRQRVWQVREDEKRRAKERELVGL